ncbi:MAG: hypothetical protein ACKON8_07895 [Planctomycetota bacterium]
MNRSWLTGFALLAVTVLPRVGFGQTSWSDSFPSGPQRTWSLAANGPTGAAQTYGSGYTILSGSGAGAVFASVSSPTFSGSTGVTVRAILNPNASTQSVANGVLAATNLAFGNAYTATITMGGSGFLEIQRNSFGSATQIASTGSAFTPGFNGLSSYLLELVVAPNSSRITANAYDSTGTTLLNSISAVDPSALTGNYTAGILMQRNNAGLVQGTFGNVSAVGVPEPSAVALAIVGAAGLLGTGGWRRLRSRRTAGKSAAS